MILILFLQSTVPCPDTESLNLMLLIFFANRDHTYNSNDKFVPQTLILAPAVKLANSPLHAGLSVVFNVEMIMSSR
jgi:hypothetical protein